MIEIEGATHGNPDDVFLALGRGDHAVLGICDGTGSWGDDGVTLPAAVVAAMRTRFGEALPAQIDDLIDVLLRATDEAGRTAAQDPDPMGFDPAFVAVVAHIAGSEVAFAWAGTAQGLVVRAGRIIARTRPHDLGRMMAERGEPLPADSAQLRGIATRIVAPGGDKRGSAEPLEVQRVASLAPGDAVVLLTADIPRLVSEAALARMSAEIGGARRIVDAAVAGGARGQVTAVIARVAQPAR